MGCAAFHQGSAVFAEIGMGRLFDSAQERPLMDRRKERRQHGYCAGRAMGRMASCSWLAEPAVTHLKSQNFHQHGLHGATSIYDTIPI